MAEALPNPLLDLHAQAGAELQAYDQTQIVTTFGQPEAEYAAIRKACGLMDLPQRGILEVSGRDRLEFLNNLLTNQTHDKQRKAGLPAGQGVYSFLLNSKGRIFADMNVLELADRAWLEMDGAMVEPVRAALDKYLFAEQVKMTSRIGSLHELTLHGPGAAEILNQCLEAPIEPLSILGSIASRLFGHEVVVWRDDPAAVSGYHLLVPSEAVASVWAGLLQRFGQEAQPGKRLLRPVGWAAFNATRIEGGRPIFRIDFDESVLPAETGQLERAVSFTKGCYLGQEIVARMQSRGQLARQLVGIRMESDALPIAGAQIFDDEQNQVGGVTSSTISPVLSGIAICMGYVKRPFMTLGTELSIPAEGAIRKGVVAAMPFVAQEH